MIVQTAPAGEPRLAVMMHEHTALSGQFARAFGNDRFEPAQPGELMFYVVSHHDAGWAEFDQNPVTDEATQLPYNLIETPAEHISQTSRLSPDFNQQHHAFCGLLSSMHSWGLYNGRYGLSNLVLIDRIPPAGRPLVNAMLERELERQKRLKAELAKDPQAVRWLEADHLFQNYKQLQFFDTLALYFNRIHPRERMEQQFEHVPLNARENATITIRPREAGTYELSPFPFSASDAEFAYAGRFIGQGQHRHSGGWPRALKSSPTRWESFRLVAP
ncbi:MAG: DUF3891 family protein [Xanthobacteraceae bacterium]